MEKTHARRQPVGRKGERSELGVATEHGAGKWRRLWSIRYVGGVVSLRFVYGENGVRMGDQKMVLAKGWPRGTHEGLGGPRSLLRLQHHNLRHLSDVNEDLPRPMRDRFSSLPSGSF